MLVKLTPVVTRFLKIEGWSESIDRDFPYVTSLEED
jgi:hypothetical protein